MNNYKEEILEKENGKALYLVPYVTFLPKQAEEVFKFIQDHYGNRKNRYVNLSCMWVNSKVSPIVEMNSLTPEELDGISDALIISTAKSTNKSLASLTITAQEIGLNVVNIGSLEDFMKYEKRHKDERVLLIKSPIPNTAEEPVLRYIKEKQIRILNP